MSLQVDDIVRLPTGDIALIAAGPFLTWPVSYAVSFDGITLIYGYIGQSKKIGRVVRWKR